MKNEIPNNYEELKKKSRNKKSWRQRLEAVNELKEYDSKQSRDIILNLALHDEVFIVKENAFRAAQAMEITKNGKPIKLHKKQKGKLDKKIEKKLTTVIKTLPEDYSFVDFKNEYKNMYPESYDLHEGNKGKSFEKWLKNMESNLSKKN